MALTEPKLFNVALVPPPAKTAPITINKQDVAATVLNLSILLPTAVPKMLAASLAPSDQPKNKPLLRKKKNSKSIRYLA